MPIVSIGAKINGREHVLKIVQEINTSNTYKIVDQTGDTPWEECKIGWIPRRCYYSKKWLLPFTKAATKEKLHIVRNGIWFKRYWASSKDAVIANLKQ